MNNNKETARISPDDWKEAFKLLGYIVLGGLVPVWGGLFFNYLFQPANSEVANYLSENLPKYVDEGQFAIYCASLLAPALYLIAKEKYSSGLKFKHVFNLLCYGGLVSSLLVFAGVTSGAIFNQTMNTIFIRWVSIGLYVIALIITLLVTAIDNSRIPPDVRGIRADDYQNFKIEFRKNQQEDS